MHLLAASEALLGRSSGGRQEVGGEVESETVMGTLTGKVPNGQRVTAPENHRKPGFWAKLKSSRADDCGYKNGLLRPECEPA